MMPFGEEYKPTPIESDIFMSDVPIDLLQSNIADQFDDPLEYTTDYLSSFIDKYRFSKGEIGDEGIDQLEEIRDEMFAFVLGKFNENYNIGMPEFTDLSEEYQDRALMSLYKFFVLNINKTLTRLVLNYIKQHGDDFIEIGNRKKSVTYLSLKKEIEDPVALSVLSDMSAVIDHIVNSEMDVDEFFKLARYDNNSMEVDFLMQAYDDYKITGNFTEPCFDLLSFDLRQEIESKVRNKLLKKFVKKKRIDAVSEELNNLDDPELDSVIE